MSDQPTDELYDELFSAARREATPEETRRRIIATLAARSQQVPTLVPERERWPRARIGYLLAAAALGALIFGLNSRRGERIDIEAESLARSSNPKAAATPSAAPPTPERTTPTEDQLRERESKPRRQSEADSKKPETIPAIGTSSAAAPKRTRTPATLEQELASVQRARAALAGGSATGALSELDRFARDFGWQKLAAESSLLRIEALTRAGRSKEARDLARRFVKQHPNNPLVDRARKFASDPETNSGNAPTGREGKQP